MTDQQNDAEGLEAPQDEQDRPQEDTATVEAPDVQPGDDEAQEEPPKSKAAKEAAKYRVRAKEAETALEEATGQVETLRRQIIDGMLPGHVNPEAFWAGGAQVQDLLADDGTIDPEAVADAATAAADRFGLRPVRGPFVNSHEPPEGIAAWARDHPVKAGLADAFSANPDKRRTAGQTQVQW